MKAVEFSTKAIQDLNEIWLYSCSEWSEKQADQYYNELVSCCEDLGRHPSIGKNYNQVIRGILGFPCNKHIIFYQVISETTIEIIRILHNRMDLPTKTQLIP